MELSFAHIKALAVNCDLRQLRKIFTPEELHAMAGILGKDNDWNDKYAIKRLLAAANGEEVVRG